MSIADWATRAQSAAKIDLISRGSENHVDDSDEIGFLALVVGIQEDGVLHDIGVDLALEHGVVGFRPSAEFDIAKLVALFLQFWGNTSLELPM